MRVLWIFISLNVPPVGSAYAQCISKTPLANRRPAADFGDFFLTLGQRLVGKVPLRPPLRRAHWESGTNHEARD